MTGLVANCPSCGAKITFRWSSAVQTTCPYCKSILVRHDVDLTKVGVVGDLPVDASPIQLGTTGALARMHFVVVGRIIYQYDRGSWNEWHVRLDDATSAWLSDAQSEYALTRVTNVPALPAVDAVPIGASFTWDGRTYQATTVTKARYRAVEGELPFETWDKSDALFIDLDAADGHFATLDYSDEAPALYLGEYADFDDLHFGNLRPLEGW